MTVARSLTEQLSTELGLPDLIPLEGGRTNRVWRSNDLVVKLYHPAGSTPLFENSRDQEWAVLTALRGLELAPSPVEKAETSIGKVLIYNHISGDIGFSEVTQVAELLGRVHEVSPPNGIPDAPLSDVVAQGLGMMPDGHPLAGLKPVRAENQARCLLHRDPVFTNLVKSPGGLRLVDWQCPGVGDPVEDLAHFISPGMNVLYRRNVLKMEEVERFLAAYPDQEVVQNYRRYGRNYHWRMACYCAWQVENRASDYQAALKEETKLVAAWPYP